MKLSDFVIHYLADLGIRHVFVVTGGYAVNLIDSLHHEPRLEHIAVNHEQVAAMAAEAYSRFNGISAVITTNAPGALNLLNGIDGAWNDSIPCIFICGQVTRSRWNRAEERTKGREIVDIVTIVQSITKYAAYVEDATKIKYYLDKAVYVAKEGRPGPVLLDIPLDVQKTQINVELLDCYSPETHATVEDNTLTKEKISVVKELIENAKRPVVLIGGGVRLSNTIGQVRQLVEKLNIPAVVTWCGFDVLPHNHPNYFGSIGSYGNRRANFTIQNSDLVLILGARLNLRQTGGQVQTFARNAIKIQVDLEEPEKQTVTIDHFIRCDLRHFFEEISSLPLRRLAIDEWRERTRSYRRKYSEILPEYYTQTGSVNVYVFMEALSRVVRSDIPLVTDCGGNLIWTMQAYQVKDGQRVFSNMGLSSMGYSLAASIGVCLANNRKPVVCIIGDGGFQVHIQELQVIRYHNLPIKIFVVNNRSYGIIKQTIESWFEIETLAELEKRCLAVSSGDGYSCPDFVEVARAYGIPTARIFSHNQFNQLPYIINDIKGPILCDVRLDEHQRIAPRLEFGRPLEDQHPLLDRDDLKEIMVFEDGTEKRDEIIGI